MRGGLFRLALGERFLLRPGAYTVIAEKSGYHELDHPIRVTDDANQAFSMTLERLPGLLWVSTGSVTGARVYVDGEAVGSTPLADAEVKEGRHALRVASERHLPYATDIDVEGGGVKQALEIELQPAWADVSIRSSPAGATRRSSGPSPSYPAKSGSSRCGWRRSGASCGS